MEEPTLDLRTSLTSEELLDLEADEDVEPRSFAAGSILVGEGETNRFALLIQKGHVKIVVKGPPARIVAIRGQGDVVGEMAALRKKPRAASIIALTEVNALHIPPAKWVHFLKNHPRAALAQLHALQERLVEATQKAVESVLGAEQKLAKAVVELLSQGLGRDTPEGTRLRFSQQELADIAGISLDSVKQIIRSFKERGIVTTGREVVVVQNATAIRKIAQEQSSGTSS